MVSLILFVLRLVALLFFESILTWDKNGNTLVETSSQRGFIILSIIMMIILLIIIFIANYKYKLKLFIFTEFTYGFVEKILLFIYLFTAIDEYGIKYIRFDQTSAE